MSVSLFSGISPERSSSSSSKCWPTRVTTVIPTSTVEVLAVWLSSLSVSHNPLPSVFTMGLRQWPDQVLLVVAILNAGRNSISFFLLLIVSMGLSVVTPSLGSVMNRVRLLTAFHFVFGGEPMFDRLRCNGTLMSVHA
jgi:hypothetical protein